MKYAASMARSVAAHLAIPRRHSSFGIMTHRSSTLRASALTIAAVILFTACTAATGYRTPIAKFQAASSVVIASTRIYLTELNKVEREHYINDQVSNRAQIRIDQLQAVQVFSREGLKARLDALDQLAGYGILLARLASSDAPESVRAQAQGLGDALKTLSDETRGLTGSDNQNFKAAVGPVAAIVGEVLDLIVQQRIKDALDKAIQTGDAPINTLLNAIRSDIVIAVERRRQSLSDLRAIFVTEYNLEAQKGVRADPERLRLLADRVRANEDRWELFGTADPGEALDAMASAHTALVNYAKSSKSAADLAALVDALEAFAARAERVGKAIQDLRKGSEQR